jgi:hypothetical protein
MNPQEPTLLAITDTPKPGEYGIVVRVPDQLMGDGFTMPTIGSTTYAACTLPGKVRSTDAVLGAMVFMFNKGGGDGYHNFYFMTPRTGGAETVAFNTHTKLLPSMWWPPVLSSLSYGLNRDGNYRLTPVWSRDAYNGTTLVTVEEFFSHTPHTITNPTFRPESFDGLLSVVGGGAYDDIRGEVHLPRCLRASQTYTLTIPSYTVGSTTYTQASITIPATNPTAWPSTLVIGDDQDQVSGGWLRKRITATKPY